MINQNVTKLISDNLYTKCIVNIPSFLISGEIIKDSIFDRCLIIGSPYLFKDCCFKQCIFAEYIYQSKYVNCEFKNCVFTPEQNLDNINDPYANMLCEGDIIGYKKTFIKNIDYTQKVIVKLLIPAKAKRINGYSNKCRAEYAKVLEIYDLNGEISKYRTGQSGYDNHTFYVKNRIVTPDSFDESKEVCSNGIHFFRTFKEAADYRL